MQNFKKKSNNLNIENNESSRGSADLQEIQNLHKQV